MENNEVNEITEDAEIYALLDEHQQLLKKYQRLSDDLSERLTSALGSKKNEKQLINQCLQLKTKNPGAYAALQEKFNVNMSSFIANQRVNEQKPLNRKGVRGRTWV
jgi:hypothetical protein